MNTVVAAHNARRAAPPRTRTLLEPATERLLQTGKLEQACPVCGIWEAASFHCSKCGRATGPADWYRNGDLDVRRAVLAVAAENPQPPSKRGRGRPRRVSPPDAPASPAAPTPADTAGGPSGRR